ASAAQLSAAAPVVQPEGTYPPGSNIQVNSQVVTVDRYLAEGGFAHVYLVSSSTGMQYVLKVTRCPDDSVLEMMRNEIGFMKLFLQHPNIVSFHDSSVVRAGSGYEVFILMEYCSGGTLIDYLNTRLEVRLTEPEILEIFRDVLAAVYHMHYGTVSSPILHRDLKIENVLISSTGKFKVCDFGSATTRTVARGSGVLTASEIRRLEDEVEKVTTLQYRAPEFCDLYSRMGVNVGVDVWALGVLLYKLCYYVTPFENSGKLAILNASYEIPSHPYYSPDLTNMISKILTVDPSKRPNVYQLHERVSQLLGVSCDLPAPTILPESNVLSHPQPQQPSPKQYQPPKPQQYTPTTTIEPMRRGRPGKATTPGGSASAVTSQNDLTTGFQNDPWAIPKSSVVAMKPPPPAVPPSKKLFGNQGSGRVSTSDIDAAFSVVNVLQDGGGGGHGAGRLSDDDFDGGYGNGDGYDDDDDDDDGGVGGLTGGGRSGADKYAAYLKRGGGGGDSDDDLGGGGDGNRNDVVVGARKGFEKVSGGFGRKVSGLFGKRANGGVIGGSGSVAALSDDGDAAGFASLDDDVVSVKVGGASTVGAGAFWANEDAFKQVEQQQQQQFDRPPSSGSSIAKKKPPPPPVPAKLSASQIPAALSGKSNSVVSGGGSSASGSFWANDAAFSQPVVADASIGGAGSFWATDDAFKSQATSSTQAEGWATDAAFETAFTAAPGVNQSNSASQGGWANEAAFAAVGPTTAAISASSGAVGSEGVQPGSSSESGGLLARNAFLLADKQKQLQGDRTVFPTKKPPPPPDSRKSFDYGKLPASAISTPVPSTTDTVPPPKPARRRPLPDTPTS
ncbi:UNVERIFIED_CONTAM: hypothetical protein HDU68_003852, partial [Siphonaria sp. JEL0065]